MDSLTRVANGSMAKPLPMRQSASRRVSGCGDLCAAISIHEQEFARAEQDLDVTSPRRRWERFFALVLLHRSGDNAGHHPLAGFFSAVAVIVTRQPLLGVLRCTCTLLF